MTNITPACDRATKYPPRYSDGMNMAKEMQSQDTLDDIQVQTNLCYQITDTTHGWRGEEHTKHIISNTKKYERVSDLQTYAIPCYQYSLNHNNESIKCHNSMYLQETRENTIEHQAEADDESENDNKDEKSVDLDNIRKCLYTTATMIVVLLLSTMVAVTLHCQ